MKHQADLRRKVKGVRGQVRQELPGPVIAGDQPARMAKRLERVEQRNDVGMPWLERLQSHPMAVHCSSSLRMWLRYHSSTVAITVAPHHHSEPDSNRPGHTALRLPDLGWLSREDRSSSTSWMSKLNVSVETGQLQTGT